MPHSLEDTTAAHRSTRELRARFPIFSARPAPFHYLDSAATTQKPMQVIQSLSKFYATNNANIHRGAYQLSAESSTLYEQARGAVQRFIGAASREEIVFTSGTTAGLNFIAQALAARCTPGATIVLSILEHHSNIVPWQIAAKRYGLKIRWVGLTAGQQFDLEEYTRIVREEKPAVVAVTALSNVLGTVMPLTQVCAIAREYGALSVVDAAQSIAHLPTNVQKIGCDFLVFSGHKLYGPTGIGVWYGRKQLLSTLEPVFGGGGMISYVTEQEVTFADAPARFEAGTPPIAEAIALEAALSFISELGFSALAQAEDALLEYAITALSKESGVTLYGPGALGDITAQKAVCAFTVQGVHPHDVATVADTFGVQVRAGHHCAMPLHARLGLPSTVRLSFGAYNTTADIDALVAAIRKARSQFGV